MKRPEHFHRIAITHRQETIYALVTSKVIILNHVGIWSSSPRIRGIIGSPETLPRENLGKFPNIVVGISWNRKSIRPQTQGPIRPQFEQSNREQLHIFTSQILVRINVILAVTIEICGFLILQTRQPAPHDRAPVHIAENIPVVAEGMEVEHVLIIGHTIWLVIECAGRITGHNNLLQREARLLTKLVS